MTFLTYYTVAFLKTFFYILHFNIVFDIIYYFMTFFSTYILLAKYTLYTKYVKVLVMHKKYIVEFYFFTGTNFN